MIVSTSRPHAPAWMMSSIFAASFLVQLLTPSSAFAGGSAPYGYTAGDIVGKVDRYRLERLVRGLSGADTIYPGGSPFKIASRYARLRPELKEPIIQYLLEEVASAGYEPCVQDFMIGYTTADIQAVELSSNRDTVWIGDRKGGVYGAFVSENWSLFHKMATLDCKVLDLERGPRGMLWAACAFDVGGLGAVFFSGDGGHTWDLKHSGMYTFSLFSIAFDDAGWGIAVGSLGTLIRTADLGESWFRVPPETFNHQNLNGCTSSAPGRFWAISHFGSLFDSDSTGLWAGRSLSVRSLYDIDFSDPGHGVIAGADSVFYTSDGGSSWRGVYLGTELRCVAMADSERVLAGGSDGEIYVSWDGGASWTLVTGSCRGGADALSAAPGTGGDFWVAGREEVTLLDPDISSSPECRAFVISDTLRGKNICFTLEGRVEPRRRILLTAHYDSFNRSGPGECAPGADDNATGVAAVLEAARILGEGSTELSVEFVLFDSEEVGLLGSLFFVEHLDPGVTLDAVVNLDMLGYDGGNDLSLVVAGGDAPQDSVLGERAKRIMSELELPLDPRYVTGGNLTSDQIRFQEVGIPAVLMIEGTREELTPNYHTCQDVVEFVDFGYLYECARAALGVVASLAGYGTMEENVLVLHQNHPNPFSFSTLISYFLPRPAFVELSVYDVSGRVVALVERGGRGSGEVEYLWDGRDERGRYLASGVYFMRLRAGAADAVRKIVVVK